MREDWRSTLVNAALMSLAGAALLVGAFMLIVKAIYRMVRW